MTSSNGHAAPPPPEPPSYAAWALSLVKAIEKLQELARPGQRPATPVETRLTIRFSTVIESAVTDNASTVKSPADMALVIAMISWWHDRWRDQAQAAQMLSKPSPDAMNSLASGGLELDDFRRLGSGGSKDAQPEEPPPTEEGDAGGATEPQGGESGEAPEGEA